MNDSAHGASTGRQSRRGRYLRLIALFKILKGVLLFMLSFSLLFLHFRTRWLDAISDWAGDEILLAHSHAFRFLLKRLQYFLVEGRLQATGLITLFYSAVLLTEGIGVYFEKRWAEYLMVFATAGLIPLELRHILHRPSLAAFAILFVNCFIVWFLFTVLRRDRDTHAPAREREIETATTR